MLRRIVAASLRFRFIVVALATGMMLFGMVQVQDAPVDVFPEFAPPRVEIQTISLGMTSEEVEALVTVPLEQALAGVDGLDVIRSTSVTGLSSILMIFEPGMDLLLARQLVQERVAIVTPTLPTWASPPFMMQPLSATSRVMKVGLTSDTVSLIDMSAAAYWTIRPRLLSVPGVANVAIWGERLQQFHVQVMPDRLVAEGVSLRQVMEATSSALDEGILRFSDANVIGTGGAVETASQQLAIRHAPSIVTPAGLASISLVGRAGKVVPLTDVAVVKEDHMPLWGDAVINDGPGLMLIVEKFPWANTLDTTRGVEAAFEEMAPGLPDIAIDTTIFRPATFIEVALANLTYALLLGSLLVFVVLVLFLYDWRTALISLVAIPLSLMAAALVLDVRGVTINTMILAGLVISVGVVVDDAIIDIENITRRLRLARRAGSDVPTEEVILDASVEVRGAVIYATLIDVVAILPVFFITGLSGAFFQPLAISYGLAVLASLVVALTVTPALALVLLRNAPIERRESPIARRLQGAYAAMLARLVDSVRPAFAVVGVVSVAGLVVATGLGQSLLPDFKERDFLMHWVTSPGTSHQEEVRISTEACIELRTIPGVRNCGSHIGQALLADEVVGIDFGENWISVDPAVDYDETRAAVQEVVDGYPGIRRDVQTYLKERIREVLTGSSDAIVVRIFGPELSVLREKAEEIEEELSRIPGIVDLHRELQVEIPQIGVEVDLAAAGPYGIKPGDVRRAASALVASEEVGDLFLRGQAYDVHVWSTADARSDISAIRRLPMDTATGGTVPLGEIADVRIVATPNSIKHEGLFRKMDVDANVEGRDLGSVTRDVQAALARVAFPQGYHAELLGEYVERQAAQDRLLLFAGVAIVGIFLLLQASFGSTRLALLSFLTLPFALVGGVLAAWLTGGVLSLGSLVGFFTVLGIAARNGIMMINHFQHLERSEGEVFGRDLVIRGARERLSPILMTALATGLALVPLAIAGDLPGHEIEHPMAVVILGGLITSTLLNLFVTPSLYLRFAEPREKTGDARVVVALAALALAVTACAGQASPSPAPSTAGSGAPASAAVSVAPSAAPSSTPVASTGAGPSAEGSPAPSPTEALVEDIGAATFSDPSTVDNAWFPLEPGTQWTWEGSATVDGEVMKRKVVFSATDLTKEIDGIRAIVGYDLDYTNDVLEESEIALWAQADDGTVWHLGQYPEVYEDGEIAETPAWFHGIEEAAAGISMKPEPQPYAPSYSQGWGPAVGWNDRAKVFEMDSETCVPADCYSGVLVIDEFAEDEPDAHQLKYYARGVGNVRVGWAGAREEEREVLELTGIRRLDPAELDKLRETVLAQEQRGYELSEIYRLTPPMERLTAP